MTRSENRTELAYLSLIIILAVIVVLPVYFFGIPDTNDLSQHFRFAQIYHDRLIGGDAFPGWADRENFGYGEIGIRFYPPLAYYLMAFARIVTGNWYDAAFLTFAFWMVAGCLGVYFWARSWLDAKFSAVAAFLYLLIPYHLHQLFTGYNNYSEFAATSLLTFCFAFLTRVLRRGRLADVLGLACFYALLIVTHLPLSVVGSLALFVYALTLLRTNRLFRPAAKAAAAVLLGLAASSFYWLAMITELDWLNHNSERFRSGHFDFVNGFFPMAYYEPNPISVQLYLITDAIAVLSFLFLATAVIYLVGKKTADGDDRQAGGIFRAVLPVGLFAFFMFTPLSRPLWQILPPLQKVQFPVRWMPIVAMCGAVVAAAAICFFVKGEFLKNRLWSYGALVLAAVIGAFNFVYILHPMSFVPLSRAGLAERLAELPETQSFDCWWAVWSKPEALGVKEKVSAGGRDTQIVAWQPEEKTFEIGGGRDDFARLAVFYYPHWQAEINGAAVRVEKDENGAILIPLPAGRSLVRVYFQEPLPVRIAGLLSVAVWLLFGAVFLLLACGRLFSGAAAFDNFSDGGRPRFIKAGSGF